MSYNPSFEEDEIQSSSILIVDDEKVNIMVLEKTMAHVGYSNIDSTTDPRNVMQMMHDKNYDLLILDLNMPYMDGFEVMEALKQDDMPKPPILVLTAQQSQQYRIRALEGGARDFLSKPFDRTELLARVRNLLEVQLAHNAIQRQNELLDQRVKERTEELHHTRLQVVNRLGLAAEYRDNETGLHIIRMSQISALLARAAGMSEEQCDLVLNAAPMHDIGKIGIPDKVLLKPGKFEPDEWEIMKTHAQIGADLLGGDDSDLLTMASEIALTHHEKWDGSGYPNGLKGEGIPLVGRIVALADVFDALTSERPYKKAWEVTEAIEFIKDQSGKHFDPELVEFFLDIIPSVVEIRDKYIEPEIQTS